MAHLAKLVYRPASGRANPLAHECAPLKLPGFYSNKLETLIPRIASFVQETAAATTTGQNVSNPGDLGRPVNPYIA